MRFLIAFLIALVIGEDSSADEPRVVVENKTPPAVVVVNKSAPVAPVAAVVCGPTGCQLVSASGPVAAAPCATTSAGYTYRESFTAGGGGWWFGKRVGRPRPLYRR